MGDLATTAAVISAIATSVSTFVVIVAAYFALSQLRSLVKARHLDSSIEIHRDFAALWPERHCVINELKNLPQMRAKNYDALPLDIQEKIFRLASFFERIGALIDHDIVDKNILFDLIGWSCVRAWTECGDVLLHWRKNRSIHLYENFECTAYMCAIWLSDVEPKTPAKQLAKHGYKERDLRRVQEAWAHNRDGAGS